MGILEQAREKAREGVEDVQARRDLHQLFAELGRETYRLYAAHELDHPLVAELAERIRGVEDRLASLRTRRA